jgi:hypothetical protein
MQYKQLPQADSVKSFYVRMTFPSSARGGGISGEGESDGKSACRRDEPLRSRPFFCLQEKAAIFTSSDCKKAFLHLLGHIRRIACLR